MRSRKRSGRRPGGFYYHQPLKLSIIIIPTQKSRKLAAVPFRSALTMLSEAERNGTGRQASSVLFSSVLATSSCILCVCVVGDRELHWFFLLSLLHLCWCVYNNNHNSNNNNNNTNIYQVATALLVAGFTLTFWIPTFASTSSYSSVFQSGRLLV